MFDFSLSFLGREVKRLAGGNPPDRELSGGFVGVRRTKKCAAQQAHAEPGLGFRLLRGFGDRVGQFVPETVRVPRSMRAWVLVASKVFEIR